MNILLYNLSPRTWRLIGWLSLHCCSVSDCSGAISRHPSRNHIRLRPSKSGPIGSPDAALRHEERLLFLNSRWPILPSNLWIPVSRRTWLCYGSWRTTWTTRSFVLVEWRSIWRRWRWSSNLTMKTVVPTKLGKNLQNSAKTVLQTAHYIVAAFVWQKLHNFIECTIFCL